MSFVEGKIVAIRKSPDIDHFSVMEVQPSRIGNAGSATNLMEGKENDLLHIHIADDVQHEHDLKEGSLISARVRLAPNNLFVIPDSVKVL